jgi:hypothetical protein
MVCTYFELLIISITLHCKTFEFFIKIYVKQKEQDFLKYFTSVFSS